MFSPKHAREQWAFYICRQIRNELTKLTILPVTTTDIEDIGERAEVTVKIFGVSKPDALRAITKLKAQEINRDLSPILELLDK